MKTSYTSTAILQRYPVKQKRALRRIGPQTYCDIVLVADLPRHIQVALKDVAPGYELTIDGLTFVRPAATRDLRSHRLSCHEVLSP